MRAAWYERTGEASAVLQVGELPDPVPGPGEVRVRVHVSGVNPADIKRRSGWGGMRMEFPRQIPHDDGAGVIDAVGAGVDPARVGERVWLWDTRVGRWTGSCAERVCVPARCAEPLPDGISFDLGACLSTPARTAHRCVLGGGPIDGATVLVAGAAGSVGTAAVQVARAAGAARVIGTVGRPENIARARAAGCDEVLDYRADDVSAAVLEATGGQGAELIVEVDLAANAEVDARACAVNGTIAWYATDTHHKPVVPAWRLLQRTVTLRPVLLYNLPYAEHRQAAADITRWLQAGRLNLPVGRRFALEDVAAGHDAVARGTGDGNVVVDLTR